MKNFCKRKTAHILYIAVISIICILLFSQTAMAFDGAIINSETVENTTEVAATFSISQHHNLQYKCGYSDDLFELDSHLYSHQLAQLSMGLTAAAFRNRENKTSQDDNLRDFYEQMGFENADTSTYAVTPSKDTIAYGIAEKKIEDFTVIAVGVCGGNYSKEWASNMMVGDEVRSEGFNSAAQKVELAVTDYIDKNNITGNIKLWISGFSRAAAVSNIVAFDFTEEEKFEDVYAYCFAAPRTTTEPEECDCIYNILSKNDVVPKVPLEDWGYERYGTDLYLKAQQTDSDYYNVFVSVVAQYYAITGYEYTANARLASQFRTIFDYLTQLIPTATDYKERFQNDLVSVMENSNADNVLLNIKDVLEKISPKTEEEKTELTELVDYLELLINDYVFKGNQEQKAELAWNPDISMAYNIMTEHDPVKYMAWLLSTDYPEEIYSDKMDYIKLSIEGKDLHVDMYDLHGYAGCADTKENTFEVEIDDEKLAQLENRVSQELPYPMPLVESSRQKLVISVPRDTIWTFVIRSGTDQDIYYAGLSYGKTTTHAYTDDAYSLSIVKDEEYTICTTLAEESSINKDESDFTDTVSIGDMNYSPSTIMRLETVNVMHLTLSEIIYIVEFILILIIIELLVSIILGIIRVVKKKRRRKVPTIVLHLVNAVIFFFLELTTWYFVPAVPMVRTAFSLFSGLFIIALALKGLDDTAKAPYKKIFVIISAILLAGNVAYAYFLMGSSSDSEWILPIAVYVITSVMAGFTWYEKKVPAEQADLPETADEAGKAVTGEERTSAEQADLPETADEAGKAVTDEERTSAEQADLPETADEAGKAAADIEKAPAEQADLPGAK